MCSIGALMPDRITIVGYNKNINESSDDCYLCHIHYPPQYVYDSGLGNVHWILLVGNNICSLSFNSLYYISS